MDILDLQVFITIVKAGSLSKASDILHISQSTVSQRLSSIENELGARLIFRDKGLKAIYLTNMGKRFYPRAIRLLEIWRESKSIIASEPLFLAIGAIDSINNYVLPPVYQKLYSSVPPIDFSVRTDYSIELYNMVERREVDVAFVFVELLRPSLIVETFFVEPMVVLRPVSDYTHDNTIVTPADLDQNFEIFFIQGPAYHIWHDKWWNKNPRNRAAIDCCLTILTLMNQLQHWSLVPLSFALWAKTKGRFIINYLAEPYFRTCYKVVHKNPRDSVYEALEKFDNYSRECLEDSLSAVPFVQGSMLLSR